MTWRYKLSKAEELENYKELLQLWRKAEMGVATGQSYTIGNRTLTRVDADIILQRIEYYEKKIRLLEKGKSGGIRLQRVTPLDC